MNAPSLNDEPYVSRMTRHSLSVIAPTSKRADRDSERFLVVFAGPFLLTTTPLADGCQGCV
jgi:hypothetical protein